METALSLERVAQILGCDMTHCWHPFTQSATAHEPLPAVGAHGAEIYLGDGSAVIDATSSWWVNIHGHQHPYMIEKISQQLAELDQILFADLTHQSAAGLARRLAHLLPGELSRVFYSDNGSTAIETALKISVQYWHNRGERRTRILAFRGGYHGETLGAMALSGARFGEAMKPLLFDTVYIDPPSQGDEEGSLAQLKQLLDQGDFCAFFFEPILQGVGGMRVHSAEVLSEMMALCRRYEVITVADEVLTGCGRTGPRFACERLTSQPDMICLAKSLTSGTIPLGVTACTETLYDAFCGQSRDRALLHGHSYAGNPLGCAAALASLDLLATEECDLQRDAIARSHCEASKRWQGDPRVTRISQAGTILALEFKEQSGGGYNSTLRDELYRFFLDNGVLIRPFGNLIHVVPPYCITQDQLSSIYDVVDAWLKRV